MSYEHSEAFKENSQLAAYSCNGGQGMGSEELAKQVSDFPGCHKRGQRLIMLIARAENCSSTRERLFRTTEARNSVLRPINK